MSDNLEAALDRAVTSLTATLDHAATAIASDFAQDFQTILSQLYARIAARQTTLSRGPDGRAQRWRCRFRIYDQRNQDEAVADSDDELPPGEPGTWIIEGLPGVATEVVAVATAYHKTGQLAGLSPDELRHRLKSLRPTLSRRGGKAVWRLEYDTFDTFSERTHKRGWLMRVDIQKESE